MYSDKFAELFDTIAFENIQHAGVHIKDFSIRSIKNNHAARNIFKEIEGNLMEKFSILDCAVNFRLKQSFILNRQANELISAQANTFFRKFHIISHDDKWNLEFMTTPFEFPNYLKSINFGEIGIKQHKRNAIAVFQ